MIHTPLGHAESLRVGTVDFVSPVEIKVELDVDVPESVAVQADGVRPFPRVNGYVLVPVDDSYLVCQIEWITIERSPFPKRQGVKDFGLIDLPYPLRKMSLNPLGILRKLAGEEDRYVFRRGADTLPSVGTPVLLPTKQQLRSIIESGERRRVRIGVSPLAGNAEVCIDPDRLFGRHLAVLGNTGSGKSCSVAGLIRWSLEAARSQREAGANPNARFIILDPNGEYSRAFSDLDLKARIFRVNPKATEAERPLRVPLWFWNSAEWCAFAQASAKTQRPVLAQALRYVRGSITEDPRNRSHELRRFLGTMVNTIRIERDRGTPWGEFPKPKSFFEKLEKWRSSLDQELPSLEGDEFEKLKALIDKLEALCKPRRDPRAHYDFTRQEVSEVLALASEAHGAFGGTAAEIELPDVDAPIRFTGDALLRSLEATAEIFNVSEHTETLLMRIRGLLHDVRLTPVIAESSDLTLQKWLVDYVGAGNAQNGCLTVVDLSLVPPEVVHLVTAVVARMVIEGLQRYRKLTNKVLPTVLVMEEAHTFIKRYRDLTDDQDAATVCCQVFERIAREGRKFGLGLVLSSQRPSELSETVLSQCNSFLLHRITNDRDQEIVSRLVPDNLRGLLRELPLLPAQHAILLGWASELPLLVRIDDLPESQRPQSDDPDFWNVWIGRDEAGRPVDRYVDWDAVAKDWQGSHHESLTEDPHSHSAHYGKSCAHAHDEKENPEAPDE